MVGEHHTAVLDAGVEDRLLPHPIPREHHAVVLRVHDADRSRPLDPRGKVRSPHAIGVQRQLSVGCAVGPTQLALKRASVADPAVYHGDQSSLGNDFRPA